MRILILPGTLDGANLGDVAMLEVALLRLREVFRGAEFFVVSRDAEFCSSLGDDVRCVSAESWKHWADGRAGSWKRILPDRGAAARKFQILFQEIDFVAMSGSGIFTDAFKPTALRLLATLKAAVETDVPAGMLGQGIGPIGDLDLLNVVREVAPKLHFTFVRDPRSAALLQQFNVPAERLICTGDDAVELALNDSPTDTRSIGVSLRVSEYGGLERQTARAIAELLKQKAGALEATLTGIPIATGADDSDVRALSELLPGVVDLQTRWTTRSLVRRMTGCRIVVAGSYHAAVFALAAGIPVVAVAQSDYYSAKFNGLAEQFGAGCTVLSAGKSDFIPSLARAVDAAWKVEETLRTGMRELAREQVRRGREAYGSLGTLALSREGIAG